jgi:hypothetical protein
LDTKSIEKNFSNDIIAIQMEMANYIVLAKSGTPVEVLEELEEMALIEGGSIQHRYRNTIVGFSGTFPRHVVERLKSRPEVSEVERDQLVTIMDNP